jgi:hypothetical protein
LESIPGLKWHCFLAHCWGDDELGRDNHQRVKKVNQWLTGKGLRTWFDEEKMIGDITDQMVDGIEHSCVVCVCITKRYLEKVESTNKGDNAQKEFKYAAGRKTPALMVPIVLEPAAFPHNSATKAWTGPVGFNLSSQLYYAVTADEDEQFNKSMQEVYRAICTTIEGEVSAERQNSGHIET